MSEGCITCEEVAADEALDTDMNQCPQSLMDGGCGHHCNHTWTHDECCWCRAVFGDEDDPNFGVPAALRQGES